MDIVPLLLLAFLFVTIGFIGGVLMTLWWVEREKRRQGIRQTGEQSGEIESMQISDREKEGTPIDPIDIPLPIIETKVIPEAKHANIEKKGLFSRKRKQKDEAEETAPEKNKPVNLIVQIDAILQDLVARSSSPERKIRLAEDPLQGVVVWVGQDKFMGIDSVPDDEIRLLIQRAVRDWELHTGSK